MAKYTDPRDAIFEEIYQLALNDKQVVMLTVDTGARKFKDFQSNLPGQFFNLGICEQNSMSVAAGLSAIGKIVYVFGISSFVTMRCLEQIKIDICCMNRHVIIIGMGTGYGYSSDGPTHHIIEDVTLMRPLPNMTVWSPSDCASVASSVQQSYCKKSPSYIRFDKNLYAPVYDYEHSFDDGLSCLRSGKELVFVTTSIMTSRALEIIRSLEDRFDIGLIDICRIKPLNTELLSKLLMGSKRIVTMEEHTIYGGIGSIVREVMCDYQIYVPIKVFGIPDVYRSEVGSRQYICSLDGIDNHTITSCILEWMCAA